jgi:pyruvate kinase
VNYLSRIAVEAEKSLFEDSKMALRGLDRAPVPDAVAFAACGAAVKVNASAIIACTETGNSARLLSKYRPQQPIYAVSVSDASRRRMALYWGVTPILAPAATSHHDELDIALRAVQTREGLPNGSLAVVTGGLSVRTPGSTSILEIREMNHR